MFEQVTAAVPERCEKPGERVENAGIASCHSFMNGGRLVAVLGPPPSPPLDTTHPGK